MTYQQRDNSGLLGKNTRKQKESHPEYNGSCVIDGREYYISAWVKEGRNGKFFSLSFNPKQQEQSRPPQRGQQRNDYPADDYGSAPAPRQQRRPPPPNFDDMDDDIPF